MSGDGFEPRDYLDLSSSIERSIKSDTDIKTEKHAAWMRCAVSRAYYSAFLSIRSEFEGCPELRQHIEELAKNHKDHQIIKRGLRKDMRIHENTMNNLRKNRNKCDYDLPPKFSVNVKMVEKANSDARDIILHSCDIAKAFDVRRVRNA